MTHFLDSAGIDVDQKLTLATAFKAITELRELISDPNQPNHLVGQENLRDRLLIALILGGHCLIEGNPGLAKTFASEILGKRSGLAFRRAQFTPDMLPSDLLFSERIDVDPDTNKTRVLWFAGPIFTNIFLADEINRASPKIQSAMLEAMQERRVTFLRGNRQVIRPMIPVREEDLLNKYGPYFGLAKFAPETHEGQHFMALATMNPLEQEGVFPLSEAQLDRFMFKLIVDYPEREHFDAISRYAFERNGGLPKNADEDHVKTLYFLSALRELLVGREAESRWLDAQNMEIAALRRKLHAFVEFSHLGYAPSDDGGEDDWMQDTFRSEAPAVILARKHLDSLRHAEASELHGIADFLYQNLRAKSYPEVAYGASPRALLNLIRAAHARAFLKRGPEDGIVRPRWEDFDDVAPDIMRHRIRVAASSNAIGLRSIDAVDKLREAFRRA